VTLGDKEQGAKAALPTWINFMATVLKDKPIEQFDTTVPVSNVTPVSSTAPSSGQVAAKQQR